jgi:hypothetical protein
MVQSYACHMSVCFELFTGDVFDMYIGIYPPYMTGDCAVSAWLPGRRPGIPMKEVSFLIKDLSLSPVLASLLVIALLLLCAALSFHTVPIGTSNCLHSSRESALEPPSTPNCAGL